MKQNIFKKLMLIAVLLTSNAVRAHDFVVGGIYYEITSSTDKTASVSYRGSSHSSYTNEYSGSVVIPESVTYNGITYSVTSIGDYAFRDCTGLKSVTIPNSITSVGFWAFKECINLTSVYISDLEAWCKLNFSSSNPLEYAKDLYINNEKVINLVLPNTITKIKNDAFYGCSLTSVTIPNSVTSIGSSAFSYCSSLTSVAIPNSVTSIGSYAFYNCTGLTNVNIPNSVTFIGQEAFYNCRGLTSVTIGNSVTSIGNYAFYCCSGLENVTIGNSVTSIGSGAFYNCSGLTSVTIPNSVTSIGDMAFYKCSGLTSVTIPEGVTSIGIDAFSGGYNNYITRTIVCNATTPPTLGRNVFNYNYLTLEVPFESILAYQAIEGWAINSNGRITYKSKEVDGIYYMPTAENEVSVTYKDNNYNSYTGNIVIPNTITVNDIKYNITSIGYRAFSQCNALVNIIISSNVSSIGNYAFSQCSNLRNIISKCKTPPNISSYTFNECPITAITLYVPVGCKEVYVSTNVWSVFERIIEEDDSPNNENQDDNISKFEISDVNCTWGLSRKDVALSQSSLYSTVIGDETCLIYKRKISDTNLYLSYKFSDKDKLCASTITVPENQETKQVMDKIFSQYEADIYETEGLEVKKMEQNIITYDKSSAINNNFITIGFSYYEPFIERDDCVDLGLSVRWATMNLGSTKPSEVGDFYAWSETTSKTEYWRENYAYCNNNSNQYVFNYTNPTTNICGTQYDVATKILGEGWKMPSLAEANELITLCTWEKETIDGVQVYRVTGPNGNSIILPRIGFKRQDKSHSTTTLYIATGECTTTDSDSFYVIKNGVIGSEWKAWGYNIRPVYTK